MFANKKRSMDSQLDFQPPTQRKRLGLSRERFLPMESSSANAHPMFSPWQQGPTSARPMPQQYSSCFKSFGSAPMPMNTDASSCAMAMDSRARHSPQLAALPHISLVLRERWHEVVFPSCGIVALCASVCVHR